ncbi:MAG TPA: hypothetical protein PKY82_18165 [Pyrinomonadaceae bacterium]|nr:hypothetical protein [Pyrinomonadaceae bacterium]
MFKPTKCPNCGGKLQVLEDRIVFKCSYCAGEFLSEHTAPESPKSETKKQEDLNSAQLKIAFSGVWMVADVEVKVFLDNQLLGTGSVKKGFDLSAETTIGNHFVELKMSNRNQKYNFEIPSDGAYLLQIDFSRTWGNFTNDVNLTRLK